MQIDIKDRLVDIKKNHQSLYESFKANLFNEFFLQLKEQVSEVSFDRQKLTADINDYMYRILYPISYTTITQTPDPNDSRALRRTEAVGKWFGQIVNTNISYYIKEHTFDSLTEKHVALTPPRKRKIVQDFFMFTQELREMQRGAKKEHLIEVNTNLYRTCKVTVSPNLGSYIDVIEEVPTTVSKIIISQRINPFTLIIEPKLKVDNSFFKEQFEISKEYISSNALGNFISSTHNHLVFLDDPQILFNNDVKSCIIEVINNAKNINKRWENMKMKYAHLLLQKGKI